MAKKEELDEETLAFIQWCIEVEGFLVAGGATVREAQDHIEEQVEWFTDQFYDGLTPEEAAKEALAGDNARRGGRQGISIPPTSPRPANIGMPLRAYPVP